ncbi:MAG TPA: hypothetical protein EYH12_01075, partial [Psychromonas hadalis]|nr:hypothetical protein [Psychromonas hadalis]
FSASIFSAASFSASIFSAASFSASIFSASNFSAAIFSASNFSVSNFSAASFSAANFSSASFSDDFPNREVIEENRPFFLDIFKTLLVMTLTDIMALYYHYLAGQRII